MGWWKTKNTNYKVTIFKLLQIFRASLQYLLDQLGNQQISSHEIEDQTFGLGCQSKWEWRMWRYHYIQLRLSPNAISQTHQTPMQPINPANRVYVQLCGTSPLWSLGLFVEESNSIVSSKSDFCSLAHNYQPEVYGSQQNQNCKFLKQLLWIPHQKARLQKKQFQLCQRTQTKIFLGIGLDWEEHMLKTRSNVVANASTTIVASLAWRTSTTFKVKQTLWAQTPWSFTLGRSSFCIDLVKTPRRRRGIDHLDWSIPS